MPISSEGPPRLADRLGPLLEQPPRLRFDSGRAEPHAAWAARLRGVVGRLVAAPAPLAAWEAEVADRGERGGLLFEDLRLSVPGDPETRVRATLLRPAGAGQHPAVLVCPGRNARLEQVTGAEPPDHPDRNVAERLARRGFATLTVDSGLLGGFGGFGGYGAERVGGRDEVNLLALALGLAGRSPLALLVEDALRSLAWLGNQPWLAAGRLGLLGHSLGGSVALHTALMLERPVPVVLASCMGRYAAMFGRDLSAGGAQALPGILRWADLPDLAAALAPAPLQIQHGERDPILPAAEARAAMEVVAAAYESAGAADRLDLRADPEMGHGTDAAQAADFFAASFARQPAAVRVAVPAAKIHFDGAARREILERIDDALTTGALTLGPYGRAFEDLARTWTGAPEAVAVSGGTSALEIGLRVLGVEGRTVLLPADTFFATAGAALHAGARVEFVDIEPEGLGMDPRRLRAALDRHPDTAAVVVVHIAGVIAPSLREVRAICRERGIPLVEDAAHALGSELDGTLAGNLGEVAAFSMYPTKIATSAEGGFITFQRAGQAEVARSLRDQGKRSFFENVHSRLGGNWRLSEPHASIGIAHLERLGAFLEERRRLAAWYDEHLNGLPGIPGITPLRIPADSATNYYKYVALLDEGIDREALRARLKSEHGVALAGEVYQIPCCAQPFFGGAFGPDRFPAAYRFCDRHICLPLFQTMTEAQQRAVVEALARELAVLESEGAPVLAAAGSSSSSEGKAGS